MSEPFHPDLRAIAHVLPRSAFTRHTIPLVRTMGRLQARRRPADVEVLTLASGAGVRLHHPPRRQISGPALLWIHGGGSVIGSAAQDDGLCRRFARRLGIPVAAVDYRLAPKHPYPAALDDCLEALAWLSASPGVDPDRIAVGGASAGGGLAAAVALTVRDRAESELALQLLVYPMLDDRSSVVVPDNRHFRLWNTRTNRLGWAAYLRGTEPDRAVPARHHDLRGVAPAWIGVGTLDPLYGEDVEYAHRLAAAGVPCELEIVPGAFHGFDAVTSRAGVSRRFFDRQCDALVKAIDW